VGYSYVLDIGEDRDFTVDCGWTQQAGMLRFGPIAGQNEPPTTAPDNYTPDPEYHNGAIRIEVLNPLTTPSGSATDVSINVYVSTADDFEVASPTASTISRLTPLSPQSGLLDPQSGELPDAVDMAQNEEENMAQQETSVAQFAEVPGVATQALLTYSGEVVVSLRTVLKRYVFHRAEAIRDTWTFITQPTYPRFPGPDPLGQETQFGNPYTYCNVTPLNWVLPAYVGYRGAIRVGVVNIHRDARPALISTLTRATGNTTSDSQFFRTSLVSSTDALEVYHYKLATNASLNGVTATVEQQPTLFAEIPYYNKKKFLFCKRNDQLGSGKREEYMCHVYSVNISSSAALENQALFSYSVGEDFQVGFYTGPPVLYEIQDLSP
jgi:hypothetical protein